MRSVLFVAAIGALAVGVALAQSINTTRSNIRHQGMVQVFAPCGGTCFGGANEGNACGVDSACPGGVCRALIGGTPVVPAVPNTVTEDGDAACTPALTLYELAGSPPTSWVILDGKAIDVKSKSGFNKLQDPLNPAGTSADVVLQIKMKGVTDSMGPATSMGTLSLRVRETRKDRVGGDMTVADRTYDVPLNVQQGELKFKTSLNAVLNGAGKHGLPAFSMQLLAIAIRDPNGIPVGAQGYGIKEQGCCQ